jgi:hypothetical protein
MKSHSKKGMIEFSAQCHTGPHENSGVWSHGGDIKEMSELSVFRDGIF